MTFSSGADSKILILVPDPDPICQVITDSDTDPYPIRQVSTGPDPTSQVISDPDLV